MKAHQALHAHKWTRRIAGVTCLEPSTIRTVTVGFGLSPKSCIQHALDRAGLPLAGLSGKALAFLHYRRWGLSPRPESSFMVKNIWRPDQIDKLPRQLSCTACLLPAPKSDSPLISEFAMSSRVTCEEINEFYASAFESRKNKPAAVTHVEKGRAVMKLTASERMLRPGGYISGPTQMAMADSAAYAAVFTEVGITPMAVTSNLNINFLRPCIGSALIADARILKLGRSLAVINVDLRAEESDKLSSQATVTYAIPAAQD